LTHGGQTFSLPFDPQIRAEVSHLEKPNKYPQSPLLQVMLSSTPV
jgi:hypothetical protein